MKANNYREMSDEKLQKHLKNMRLELIKAHGFMEMANYSNRKGKKVKGRNLQPKIRKEIARILTIQNERKNRKEN